MSSQSDNLVERGGHALYIRLNRPEASNAITPAMRVRLDAAMDRIEVDRPLRALVITGQGKAFCAANNAIESAQNACKQATDVAQSNFDSLTTTAVRAAKSKLAARSTGPGHRYGGGPGSRLP